jgi:DNA polymerase-3 subunit delta
VAVLREDQFASFLTRQIPSATGLLIYGDDSAAAEDFARQTARKATGGDDHAIVRLEASGLSADPSRIADEVMAMSLLGGRSAIIVSGCDESTLKFCTTTIESETPANFLILIAGSLNKSSKLRAACEQAGKFYCMPLYEAKVETILAAVNRLLQQQGLKFADDAATHFLDTIGTDRMTAMREVEKLATFAHGQTTVTVADIDAVCGDTANYDADALIDAVFSGDLDSADRVAQAMDAEGSAARPMLPLLASHAARLQALQLDVARGMTPEGAVAAAKPMIFFNRRRSYVEHLRNLDLARLEQIQVQISDAIAATRKMSALAHPLTSRCLLSIARLARAARRR